VRIRAIGVSLVLALAMPGCSIFDSGSVGYKPPFVPIEFSINTEGEISVSIVGELVTPLGTFSVEGAKTVGLSQPDDATLVVIREPVGGAQRDHAYRINTNQELHVELDGKFLADIARNRVTISIVKGKAATVRITEGGGGGGAPPPGPGGPAETQGAQGSGACGGVGTYQVKVPSIKTGAKGDSVAAIQAKLAAICMDATVQQMPSFQEAAGAVSMVWLPIYEPFTVVMSPASPINPDASKPGRTVTVNSFYKATIIVSGG